MSEELKIGDVVQLQSGGERMTIEYIDEGDISCVWFEGKQPQRNTFAAGVLRKAPPMAAAMTIGRG